MFFEVGKFYRHVNTRDADILVIRAWNSYADAVYHLTVHYVNRKHDGVFATGDHVIVDYQDLPDWKEVT